MAQVTHIEIEVGQLPDWYHDGHDAAFEDFLREAFGEEQFDGADCDISYAYEGRTMLYAYDDDGNLTGQTPIDISGALQYARNSL